jgi:hypothetical protein
MEIINAGGGVLHLAYKEQIHYFSLVFAAARSQTK